MESNVDRIIAPADEPDLIARAQPFPDYAHADPPSIEGHCSRCGWPGRVYRGRYGGWRCPVCFGIQNGYMPRAR